MCGLFGVVAAPGYRLDDEDVTNMLEVGRRAQRRGSDASGLVLIDDDHGIDVTKANHRFATLLRTAAGKELIQTARQGETVGMFGHSRLETHGYSGSQINNQPIVVGNWVVVHNGVITNEREIRASAKTKVDNIETDTVVIALLLDEWDAGGRTSDLDDVFSQLRGEYSIVAASAHGDVLFRTNVGNLYTSVGTEGQTRLASEPRQFLGTDVGNCTRLPLDTTVWLRTASHEPVPISTSSAHLGTEGMEGARGLHLDRSDVSGPFAHPMEEVATAANARAAGLRRCSRCLLPETFPGLTFDTSAVCSICQSFSPPDYRGLESFETDLRARTTDGESVLACLSGGRDSCYVLHLLCELGFKPIAYTYDWGMVTTAARENMSRMCGDLGVEHVVVSPDIRQNRRRIHRALEAWLKHPKASTIPILMAGDKPYFRWARTISEERGSLPAVMADHPLETTGFKSMLAGATLMPSKEGGVVYRLSTGSLAKMTMSYFLHAFQSPGLFPSLFKEGARGFVDYYLGGHDFVRPFSYIPWDEEELETTLRDVYDWSSDENRASTSWRMGDGTAPFYNLMYLIEIGMTEHDALRSNQIRYGLATREEAIQKLNNDNQLNVLGLASYFATVGIDQQWAADRIVEYADTQLA